MKFLWVALFATMSLAPLAAQENNPVAVPILTIDSDRVFRDSEFGQRVLAEEEASTALLNAENRKIEAELFAEEQRLTEDREDMSVEDFRIVADAFDDRVVEIRRIQDGKEQEISRFSESERIRFFRSLGPVFQQLLSETGAQVVLERRATFASVSSIDLTDRTIQIANSLIGTGEEQTDQVSEEAE